MSCLDISANFGLKVVLNLISAGLELTLNFKFFHWLWGAVRTSLITLLNYRGDDVCGSRSRCLINLGLWLKYGFWLGFIHRSGLRFGLGCFRLGVLRAECIFIIFRLFFMAVARSAVMGGSEHWD